MLIEKAKNYNTTLKLIKNIKQKNEKILVLSAISSWIFILV